MPEVDDETGNEKPLAERIIQSLKWLRHATDEASGTGTALAETFRRADDATIAALALVKDGDADAVLIMVEVADSLERMRADLITAADLLVARRLPELGKVQPDQAAAEPGK